MHVRVHGGPSVDLPARVVPSEAMTITYYFPRQLQSFDSGTWGQFRLGLQSAADIRLHMSLEIGPQVSLVFRD